MGSPDVRLAGAGHTSPPSPIRCCLFDNLVCAEDELCSDEEVIGVCVSASSSHRPRWLPMGVDGVGALEAEMTRVAGLGFDWAHPYTQCVFQTLLHHIRNRRSYSSEESSQLMIEPSQLGDPLASNNIMQDMDGKIYIPGGDIEEDDNEIEEDEEPSPEEQARAWMGLQQALEGLQNPGNQDYSYDREEPIVLIDPQDSENIYNKYAEDIPQQYFDRMLPYAGKQQQQHPLEKREAVSSYNLVLRPTEEQQEQANLYNLIQPDREEYIVPDTFESLYNTNAQLYEPFDDAYVPEYRELSENDANDNLEDEEDIDWRAMNAEEDNTRPKDKRQVIQAIPQPFLQDSYSTEDEEDDDDESDSEDAKDISNYDFDYEDSSAAADDDEDDILYYNGESGEPMFYNKKNEPVPVESVFDRRERLDVKKPGPFFAHSPNNFFLDKLLPENFDENSDEDNVEDDGEEESGGQTEYELPLSQQTRVLTGQDRSRLLLLLLLGSLTLAAIGAALGFFLMLRRRGKKIGGGVEENREAEKEEPVKEYKQLVRDWSRSSRASQGSVSNGAKGSENGQDSPLAGKRVHKISGGRNSEGSRTSSTSSWQEEPSATAMDISTGHMVLSYMEDHLKNKQRLEREWVGLCAYEAEPNSTAIAFKVENKKKNRYPDKLPYDHNRVLLNALANGTNSDYINASTVMDHDPRNPAYIVTQGPM